MHILTANCIEITRDTPETLAYEIFSIERRFWQSRLRSSRFKESSVIKPQIWVMFQNALLLFYCTFYSDFPGDSIDAVARHVSFAQTTCIVLLPDALFSYLW